MYQKDWLERAVDSAGKTLQQSYIEAKRQMEAERMLDKKMERMKQEIIADILKRINISVQTDALPAIKEIDTILRNIGK